HATGPLATIGPAGPVTAAGPVADEPATARALAGHLRRALDVGLLDDADLAATGLTRETVAAAALPPPGTHRPSG
uniref:DUF6986 family protein n=1 Tax=Frankia sp. CiP1_Cm_nod1 TaxID=2897160 RepID=UPI004044607A